MNTTEFRLVNRRHPQANRTVLARWNPSSIAAVVLAGFAVLGRAASFLAAGPSSLNFLLVLLTVAIIALICARRVVTPVASAIEGKLVGMARRIATIQILVSLALIVVSLR
jgi:hypothetical protein